MIAADGTPVGFNTAVLSEIGRRLGVNIQLVSIDYEWDNFMHLRHFVR